MNPDTLAFIRHLSKNDPKTLTGRLGKTMEELGELSKAVLPYENQPGTTHRVSDKRDILEEVADILLCVYSIAYAIGADDAQIEEMVLEKSRYWSELQYRETKAPFPLPFEIHVTVSAADPGFDPEKFVTACRMLEVKPIMLDLKQRREAGNILDVMTSSVCVGHNSDAMASVERIATGLENHGFRVVRKKVETVPWHPAVPKRNTAYPAMPADCYLECHFNALIRSHDQAERLKGYAETHGLHFSRNRFKTALDGTTYNQMATVRWYQGNYDDFADEIERIKADLEGLEIETEKVIVEFSIYDTKTQHDVKWLGSANLRH